MKIVCQSGKNTKNDKKDSWRERLTGENDAQTWDKTAKQTSQTLKLVKKTIGKKDEMRPQVQRHFGSKRLLMENEKTTPFFPKKSTWAFGNSTCPCGWFEIF